MNLAFLDNERIECELLKQLDWPLRPIGFRACAGSAFEEIGVRSQAMCQLG
jgi:hypothetical protein